MNLRRTLVTAGGTWLAVSAVLCGWTYASIHVRAAPEPALGIQHWLTAVARAVERQAPPPVAPEALEAQASTVTLSVWHSGRVIADGVERGPLTTATLALARSVGEAARGQLGPGSGAHVEITVSRGDGPLWLEPKLVASLGIVPLRDGVLGECGDARAALTPTELVALGVLERGVTTPIPELVVGVQIDRLLSALGRKLHVARRELATRCAIRRFVAWSTDALEARADTPTEQGLRRAARDASAFLIRHQRPDGQFTYLYDAQTGRDRGGYSLARHAGVAYFLAQIHRLDRMPEAAEASSLALAWMRARLESCGDETTGCLVEGGLGVAGPTALFAIATAELLDAGFVDDELRRSLERMTTFLRGLEQPDGSVAHFVDPGDGTPTSERTLYVDGQVALALGRAYDVLGDRENVEAARRLLAHVTGPGWSFFGDRYFYGSEHWTCIAAGALHKHGSTPSADAFCAGWMEFLRALQFDASDVAPWSVAGAYGVTPWILPRVTPASSATEGAISTYEVLGPDHPDAPALRRQIEDALAFVLKVQWRPGPVHLFVRPADAFGGVPSTPAELTARNDFAQHAGSAMLRWAEVLRRESGGRRDSR